MALMSSSQRQWVWSAWLVAVAVTLMPVLLEKLSGGVEFLGFLTTIGLVGAKEFHRQQKRDRNVRDYCKVNNIKLLEISYLQYPIIEQLLDVVFEKK